MIGLQESRAAGATPIFLTAGSATVAVDGKQVVVTLDTDDVNRITAAESLAVDNSSVFLVSRGPIVTDTSSVPLATVAAVAAIQLTLTDDVTRPSLVQFALDMNASQITLSFDETMNAASYNASGLTLQSSSSAGAADAHAFTGGTVIGGQNGVVLTMSITLTDLLTITSKGIGLTPSTAWLVMERTTLTDMAGRDVNARGNSINAINATTLIPDTIAPTLSNFTLSMNTGLLTLTFTETIDRASLRVGSIVLQDDAAGLGSFVSLSAARGSSVQSVTESVVRVVLGDLDLNGVKVATTLCTDTTDCFVSAHSDLATDTFANPVTIVSGLIVSVFEPDATAPTLDNFNFDLSQESPALTMAFTFSEAVDATSLDVTQLSLADSLGSVAHSFIGEFLGAIISVTDINTVVTVSLSNVDANQIKALDSIGASRSTTTLLVGAGFISDMNQIPVTVVPFADVFQPVVFVTDSLAPTLATFTVDMTSGILVLTFSETVNASSVQTNHFSLQDSTSTFSVALDANSGRVSTGNSPIVSITLTAAELDAVKAIPQVFSSLATAFLSAPALAVSDMFGNQMSAIAAATPLQAVQFTGDAVPPTLLSFDLDMNSRLITLTFSEAVNSSSVDLSLISLHGSRVPATTSVALSTSSAIATFTPIVTVAMSTADFNAVTVDTTLATNGPTTFVALASGALRDMAGVAVVSIAATAAVPVSSYTADTVLPVLTSFALNLNETFLVLSFSETVNASSLTVSQITLQNTGSNASTPITLTATSVASGSNGPVIVVTLSTADDERIKLADLRAPVFLSAPSGAISDMSGVTTDFTQDSQAPRLDEFDLDMNTGLLSMRFSEAMDIESLHRELLRLSGTGTCATNPAFQLLNQTTNTTV
jgi:hypothetical protein